MIRLLFVALCTCLSSSASFPVVAIFLTFEAPQRCRNILFNHLEAKPDFHFLGNMESIKSQDICISQSFLFTFSDSNSFDVLDTLFSQGCCYVSKGQLLASDHSYRCIQSPIWTSPALKCIKRLHLEDALSTRYRPPQASFHSLFFHISRSSS